MKLIESSTNMAHYKLYIIMAFALQQLTSAKPIVDGKDLEDHFFSIAKQFNSLIEEDVAVALTILDPPYQDTIMAAVVDAQKTFDDIDLLDKRAWIEVANLEKDPAVSEFCLNKTKDEVASLTSKCREDVNECFSTNLGIIRNLYSNTKLAIKDKFNLIKELEGKFRTCKKDGVCAVLVAGRMVHESFTMGEEFNSLANFTVEQLKQVIPLHQNCILYKVQDYGIRLLRTIDGTKYCEFD